MKEIAPGFHDKYSTSLLCLVRWTPSRSETSMVSGTLEGLATRLYFKVRQKCVGDGLESFS